MEHERTTQEMQRVAERLKPDVHLEVVRESAAVWKERNLNILTASLKPQPSS